MEYFDLVSRLPLPTPEQTASFADHVADNHSWYKHLPFFPPGAGFVLFLNPHTGCGVRKTKGAFSVYDIEQGDYFEHHSRLSTKDYRDQFGQWDYWVDDNPRVAEPREGPWIFRLVDGQRELLPSDVKQQWQCRLTAFLKLAPAMFTMSQSALEKECESFLGHTRNSDPDASRYQDFAREAKRGIDSAERNTSAFSFMKAEANVQRKRLQDLLNKIRDDCATVNRKNA